MDSYFSPLVFFCMISEFTVFLLYFNANWIDKSNLRTVHIWVWYLGWENSELLSSNRDAQTLSLSLDTHDLHFRMQNKHRGLPINWRNEISFQDPKYVCFPFPVGPVSVRKLAKISDLGKTDTTTPVEQKRQAGAAITISRCVWIEAHGAECEQHLQAAGSIFNLARNKWTNCSGGGRASGRAREELSQEPLSSISSYHLQFHAAVNSGNSITLFVPVLSERAHRPAAF